MFAPDWPGASQMYINLEARMCRMLCTPGICGTAYKNNIKNIMFYLNNVIFYKINNEKRCINREKPITPCHTMCVIITL